MFKFQNAKIILFCSLIYFNCRFSGEMTRDYQDYTITQFAAGGPKYTLSINFYLNYFL